MGCCFSKATTQNQNPNHQITPKNQQPHEPPPNLEEESVKEVLSETPISKPYQVPILMPDTKTQMPFVQNPPEKLETKDPVEEVSEVVSHLTETCSISESFSTATTATATTTTAATVTEKKAEEDEATSKRSSKEGTTNHKWDRSPSRKRPHATDGNFASGRERRVKSPARRPEPSPEKKIKGGSRVVRGRGSGPVANRKLNAGSAAIRRDSGEGSRRRSRSPSCTRTSGRKQVPPANEKEKEKEKEKNEKEKSESKEEVEEKNDIVSPEEVEEKSDIVSPEECIENPHVSMECFIFL